MFSNCGGRITDASVVSCSQFWSNFLAAQTPSVVFVPVFDELELLVRGLGEGNERARGGVPCTSVPD